MTSKYISLNSLVSGLNNVFETLKVVMSVLYFEDQFLKG